MTLSRPQSVGQQMVTAFHDADAIAGWEAGQFTRRFGRSATAPLIEMPLHDGAHVFGFAIATAENIKTGDPLVSTVQRSAGSLIGQFAAMTSLRVAAETDALTGLANRRHFDLALTSIGRNDAVVMIDLDHFKRINDTYGHSVGDDVLRSLAERLRSVVGSEDCAARFGGEEFGVIVRSSNGWRARALIEGLAREWRAQDPLTTFSGGIAEHGDVSPEQTLARADQALYEAKAAGRDRVITKPRETLET